MRNGITKFNLIAITALLAVSLLQAAYCPAQPQHQPNSSQDDPLKKFLRQYLGEPNPTSERDWPTQYSFALVDLKDDGTKETIVYISGRDWCGSGGCTMLILAPEVASFKVITETTVTRLPIRVLNTKSSGWYDISVLVAGGGIDAHEAELSFNGQSYPTNPTTPPARPLSDTVDGKTVIPETAKGMPLYQ